LIRNKFWSVNDSATHLLRQWDNIGQHGYIELYHSPRDHYEEDEDESIESHNDDANPQVEGTKSQDGEIDSEAEGTDSPNDDATPQNEYYSDFEYYNFDPPRDHYNSQS